jgi:NADPH:quinone reductase-like Zn-dependent oxidoreductase
MTTVPTALGGIVVVLGAATRVPTAAEQLLRACIPVITTARDLRAALSGLGTDLDAEEGGHVSQSPVGPGRT